MCAVDAVVHTSITPEPFGRVIVEGMLAQRPVVAARAGGVLEIVDDYENGMLCTPGDAHALADALAELSSNDELRARLVKNGYKTALSRFGTDTYVGSVERILRRVASSAKVARASR